MTELVVERRLTFNLAQAKALVTMFDGDGECEIIVAPVADDGESHSGPGLYAWEAEYPDEGSHFLGQWR